MNTCCAPPACRSGAAGRHFVAREMRKNVVNLRLGCTLGSVTREHGALSVTLADADTLAADTVLYATDRAPNTEGLGQEAAGVQQDEQGAIRVDAHYQTSVLLHPRGRRRLHPLPAHGGGAGRGDGGGGPAVR